MDKNLFEALKQDTLSRRSGVLAENGDTGIPLTRIADPSAPAANTIKEALDSGNMDAFSRMREFDRRVERKAAEIKQQGGGNPPDMPPQSVSRQPRADIRAQVPAYLEEEEREPDFAIPANPYARQMLGEQQRTNQMPLPGRHTAHHGMQVPSGTYHNIPQIPAMPPPPSGAMSKVLDRQITDYIDNLVDARLQIAIKNAAQSVLLEAYTEGRMKEAATKVIGEMAGTGMDEARVREIAGTVIKEILRSVRK